MSLRVKLWGIRGSLPSPHSPAQIESRLKDAIRGFAAQGLAHVSEVNAYVDGLPASRSGGYGGNTACVEVSTPHQRIIIDGGSGLRGLGETMMGEPLNEGHGEIHILFTHFHWDHLLGLPFFNPIFVSGNKIHFYAVQEELEEAIRGIFRKPYFPVPFEELPSDIHFHSLEPRVPIQIGDMSITPYKLDHPDPCWGFRVESEGRVYAHCVDTECARVSVEEMGLDLPLYSNADLVLFDAQYTLQEATEKMNWGHSAAPIGIEVALRENVKQIVFAHHDPGASDDKIADAERQTREYIEARRAEAIAQHNAAGRSLNTLKWSFAREGQVIDIL